MNPVSIAPIKVTRQEGCNRMLLRISMRVEEVPEIQQIDLNHLCALPPGEMR